MQAPGRQHDEAVDLVGEGPGRPHLLLGVLAGVDQQQLEVGLAGGPTGRPHQRREVRVGDVGHDHGHVAGAAGDQPPGGAVGDEVQLARPRPRPAPGSPAATCSGRLSAGDRGGVHAGPGRPRPRSSPARRAARSRDATPRHDRCRAAASAAAARPWCRRTTGRGPPSIVHLGVGAFARAHLGVYADDLLRAGWPAMIRGVSLRSRAGRGAARPAGRPLHRRPSGSPGRTRPLRVVGSLASVATGRDAAVEAIAAPTHDAGDAHRHREGLRARRAPAAAGDRRRACARRRRRAPPPVVASLDNLLDNGGAAPRAGARGRRAPRRRPRPLDRRRGARSRARSSTAWCRRRRRPTSTRSRARLGLPRRGRGRRRAPPLVGDRGRRRPPAARPTSASRSSPTSSRTSGASCGCSTGRTRPSPTAGCWPAATTIAEAAADPVVAAFVRAAGRRRPRGGRRRRATDPAPSPRTRSARFAQPRPRPHLRAGRGRRLAEAPAAAAAGGAPAGPSSASPRTASPSSSPSGWPPSPAAGAGRRPPRLDDPAADALRADVRRPWRARSRLGPDVTPAFAGRGGGRPGRRARVEGATCSGRPHVTAIIGGADEVLDDERGRRLRRASSSTGSTSTVARLCLVIPDATRQCPLPLLLGAIHRRRRRPGPLVHRGGRARHPRADGRRRRCGRSSAIDGLDVREPRVVGRRHLRPGRHARRRRRSPACRAAASTEDVRRPGQPPGGRERRDHHRRARCCPTRSSASPAATSTCSPACRARSSSTSPTGSARSSPAPRSSAPGASPRSGR